MKKDIIKTCLKVSLLTIRIIGIRAFWNYDIFNAKHSSVDAVLSNKSLRSIPDDNEPGFDFDEHEMVKFKLWPKGLIPYYIDTFSFDKVFRDKLRIFLEDVNHLSGAQFTELYKPPEDENSRWILFLNRRGLLSSGGYTTKDFTNEGVQRVVLGYNSFMNGELFEFVLAAAGVPPQHNAPNRNKYITVIRRHIMPEKLHLFKILKDNEWLFHDLPYDFMSAGHFDFHRYSVTGYASIKPKMGMPGTEGRGHGFTFNDISKMRMLYNFIAKKEIKSEKEFCQKIFVPGAKLNKYSKKIESRSPRKKPEKYLGTSNDNDNEKEREKLEQTDEELNKNRQQNEGQLDTEELNEAVDRTGEKYSAEGLFFKPSPKSKLPRPRWKKAG